MAKLPGNFRLLLPVVLIVILSGCELQRDSADVSDPGPVGELPTLAPLGSESVEVASEATPVPTVINVEPTATESALEEGDAASDPDELVAPTSEPASIPATPAADTTQSEASAAVQSETFTAPVAEAETAEESASQESIVVDATTEDLAQEGGPIASNPPASQTTGDYAAPAYDGTSYTVQPGDTLFSIATRYGTTVEALAYSNGLSSDLIYVGQQLTISAADDGSYAAPPTAYDPVVPGGEGAYHVVAPGETLFRIALTYGTSVDAVAAANGIPYPFIIQVGQELVIPAYGSNPGLPPPPEGGYYQPSPESAPPDYYQPDPGFQPEPGFAPQEGYGPDYGYQAPGQAGTHTVAPGETLFLIAQRYGTTAQAIASANGLGNPNAIYVGQVLYLP